MAALFQFPSEALIAAITSRRASVENASSLFVSSRTRTSSDKLLTAAFSTNMMVIRKCVFLLLCLSLLSGTCKEISDVHQTLAYLRRMECVCVCVYRVCRTIKHDSPRGVWSNLCCGVAGREGGFFILAKRRTRKYLVCLKWKVHRRCAFYPAFLWVNESNISPWLVRPVYLQRKVYWSLEL